MSPPRTAPPLTALSEGPRRLGSLEIIAELGVGRRATAFVARATDGDTNDALRVVRIPHGSLDPELFAADLRAARTFDPASALEALETEEGLVADGPLVVGESLATILADAFETKRPLDIEIALAIAIGIASKLARFGERRVHGDLAPHHVIVGYDGTVHLLDPAPTAHAERAAAPERLGYRSPEHVRAEPLSPPSDVFVLGVLLFEMTTATPLFDGPGVRDPDAAILEARLPRPRDLVGDGYPIELQLVLRKLLRPAQAGRFPDGTSTRDALRLVAAVRPEVTPAKLGAWLERTFADRHAQWREILEGAAEGAGPEAVLEADVGERRDARAEGEAPDGDEAPSARGEGEGPGEPDELQSATLPAVRALRVRREDTVISPPLDRGGAGGLVNDGAGPGAVEAEEDAGARGDDEIGAGAERTSEAGDARADEAGDALEHLPSRAATTIEDEETRRRRIEALQRYAAAQSAGGPEPSPSSEGATEDEPVEVEAADIEPLEPEPSAPFEAEPSASGTPTPLVELEPTPQRRDAPAAARGSWEETPFAAAEPSGAPIPWRDSEPPLFSIPREATPTPTARPALDRAATAPASSVAADLLLADHPPGPSPDLASDLLPTDGLDGQPAATERVRAPLLGDELSADLRATLDGPSPLRGRVRGEPTRRDVRELLDGDTPLDESITLDEGAIEEAPPEEHTPPDAHPPLGDLLLRAGAELPDDGPAAPERLDTPPPVRARATSDREDREDRVPQARVPTLVVRDRILPAGLRDTPAPIVSAPVRELLLPNEESSASLVIPIPDDELDHAATPPRARRSRLWIAAAAGLTLAVGYAAFALFPARETEPEAHPAIDASITPAAPVDATAPAAVLGPARGATTATSATRGMRPAATATPATGLAVEAAAAPDAAVAQPDAGTETGPAEHEGADEARAAKAEPAVRDAGPPKTAAEPHHRVAEPRPHARAAEPPAKGNHSRVLVKVRPKSAKILVDGKPAKNDGYIEIGSTPVEVVISAPGYVDFVQRLAPGSSEPLQVLLKKKLR